MLPLRLKLPPLTHPILRRNTGSNSVTLTPSTRNVFISELEVSFPYRWLRDACQCSACIHPSTLQKLHRTSDVLGDVHPEKMTLTGRELHITWHDDPQHKSVYPLEWLKSYASEENRTSFHGDIARTTWSSSQLFTTPHLFVDYSKLYDDNSDELLHAVTQLIRYGIVFVQGIPNNPTDDKNCELRRLASVFGRIRNTFYGEVWNVKNVRNSTNIAYTNLHLGLHMDLLYCQHPPRYQILHALRNRVQGGTSLFVDTLHTAHKLQAQSWSAFDVLTRTPVPYHYINDGHHLHHSHPVLSLSPFNRLVVEYINYSPPFQAPLPLHTPEEFYVAFKQFADLLVREEKFEYTLREGEAVMFDNRRIVHARTGYSERVPTPEWETSRWLKGCYLEADDLLDLSRRLRKKAETALPSF